MTEKEFLRRYNNGDLFNNKELAFLLHEFQKIETTYGRATQNSQEVRTIISAGGRYFLIDWYKGLGDFDADDFYCRPREVRKKEKTVIEYEEIKKMKYKSGDKIKIKYHADVSKIEKIEKGDWIDLRSAEDVDFKHGEYKNISLGVSMELPEGYEAYVLPRSSTFKHFGIILVNGVGIIDNSYNGDNDIWQFPALCLNPEGTHIKKGDRIAQFRITKKQPEILFDKVETLGNDDRGGIGSTGVK